MPSSSNAVFIENGRFVDYFGNPIDITNLGLVGPTGSTGATGDIGPTGSTAITSATSARKVIKEFLSVADGDNLLITRAELETAIGGPATTTYFTAGGTGTTAPNNSTFSYADMHVQLWVNSMGVWIQYNTGNSPVGVGAGQIITIVNDTTGDITISLAMAPFTDPIRVRAVITL
jgi:hypothetical protein